MTLGRPAAARYGSTHCDAGLPAQMPYRLPGWRSVAVDAVTVLVSAIPDSFSMLDHYSFH
jgi:hypothetical protein